MTERVLTLALKGEYFDQIKAGTKVWEYRLATLFWTKRLDCRVYDTLVLTRGYPRRGDTEKRISMPYKGYRMETITHPHFGTEPVTVFAIDLR